MTEVPTARRDRWAPWLGLGLVVATGVALDQASKSLARARLPGRPFQELVPGLLELRYSLNSGVAFGLGQELPDGLRVPTLVGAAAFAMGVLLWLFKRERRDARVRSGVALLLAGGAGNLWDRLRFGEVTDFLHLRAGDVFQLGTFNLADVMIAAGFVPLLLSTLCVRGRPSCRADRAPDDAR